MVSIEVGGLSRWQNIRQGIEGVSITDFIVWDDSKQGLWLYKQIEEVSLNRKPID